MECAVIIQCFKISSLILWSMFGLNARGLEKKIYEQIVPPDYDSNILPLQPLGEPTPVYLSLEVIEIDEVREDKMEFSIQIFVNDIWRDPRLNYTSLINNRPITLPKSVTNQIWMPDLVFDNSKYGKLYDVFEPNIFLKIYPAKFIVRTSRYSIIATCRMKLHNYPMDEQACHLGIGTLYNSDEWLNLKWSTADSHIAANGYTNVYIDPDLQTVKYFVKAFKLLNSTQKMADGNFTILKIRFTFVRHLSRHLSNVYIPSGLIVLLSFISFWLHPSAAPARVALGLTSLLTLVTQASQAQATLPPINYMTAMDIWFFVCIVMVFSSLVEYACVYNLGQKAEAKKEIRNIPKLITSSHSPILSLDHNHHIRRRHANMKISRWFQTCQHTNRVPSAFSFKTSVHIFDKVSRVIFPAWFLLFTLCYFIHYKSR